MLSSDLRPLSHPKFRSKFVLTLFTLEKALVKVPIKITLNCECNSNMDILLIMLANMVNAVRLQINASDKQFDSNTL